MKAQTPNDIIKEVYGEDVDVLTVLKEGYDVREIVGAERYDEIINELKDCEGADMSLDGIIDLLNGQRALYGDEYKVLTRILNNIELAIDWTKGKPYSVTRTGLINDIGPLGDTRVTRAIGEEMDKDERFKDEIHVILQAYLLGNWGYLEQEDKDANDAAVISKNRRILGAYDTTRGPVWIITESDRHATTILFREEY